LKWDHFVDKIFNGVAILPLLHSIELVAADIVGNAKWIDREYLG
jgi:hypothetical protein